MWMPRKALRRKYQLCGDKGNGSRGGIAIGLVLALRGKTCELSVMGVNSASCVDQKLRCVG